MELSTDMMTVSSRTFGQLLPEAVLIATAVLVMVGGAFLRSAVPWRPLALSALVLAAILLAGQPEAADNTLAAVAEFWSVGPVFAGDFSLLVRWMAIVFGGFYFLSSRLVAGGLLEAEAIGLLLLVVAGTMLAGSAGDLVFIVLGLELVSIPTYGILFLARGQGSAWPTDAGEHTPQGAVVADWAAEATVKYFFLSLFSSALLLYGLSFLYGAAGSMDLPAIADTLAAQMRSAEGSLPGPIVAQLVPLAFLLMVAGLAFKLAAVPLHFYAPDVYQGTSHANAGLLAVAPKLAALAVLIRILATIGPALGDFAWQLLVVMAVVSMTWGNAMALRQREIRRMLAYSSIAHAGYLLVGLAVACGPVASGVTGPAAGYSAALYYLLVYALATLGAFAALAHLAGSDRDMRFVEDLSGAARSSPAVALAFAVSMLSLTGIPPLAGFWGKFGLLSGAIAVASGGIDSWVSSWFLVLAIAGAVNAAIGAGYYLRLAGTMFFRRGPLGDDRFGFSSRVGSARLGWRSTAWVATLAAGLLVVAMGIVPAPFLQAAARAGRAVAGSRGEISEAIATTGIAVETASAAGRRQREAGSRSVAPR